MTVVNFSFPQSGDQDFSENFATWLGRGNITNYVETGFNFTVDYNVPEVTVSEGKAYVMIDQDTISSNNETRLNLDYTITKPSETLGLTNNDVNYIYITPNINSNDSPTLNVYLDTASAASDALLIGEIDTTNDTAEELNREPDAGFGTASVRTTFNLPVYSELSDAETSESNTVWVDGNGSSQKGLYVYDGSQFYVTGVRDLDELNDVTGITSITAATAGSRPAAGNAGAIFIDTTNEKIQYDTGGAWVDIGVNANNINAGDLSFDPATQVELDTHEANASAHHTRPTAGVGLEDIGSVFRVSFDDGEEALFGSGDDMTIRYDAATDSLRVQNNTGGTDLLEVDRTTGDLTISGTFTEGTTL